MAEVSLDGHWLTVNRRLCEITGYEPEELRQMTFADVTHPDDLDRDLLQAKALLRGDIPSYSMNKRYLRKDGSQIWVRLTGSLKRGERGEPEYFIASVDDISEQIRTKEELDRSESVFRTVVNAIPQLTWMARPDGHIYWYNDRWREYTGIKTGEVEEGGWQSVHHPEFLQKVIDRWKQSLEAGSPFEMEFPMRGADGRFRWFLTRVLPVRNAAGQVSLWVGTNTLIDEQ